MTKEKIEAPSSLLLSTEVIRSVFSLGTYFAAFPLLQLSPKGDGHTVLVLPGFLTSDNATIPLRFFLQWRNYEAHPWNLGTNFVNYEALEHKLEHLVKALAERSKQKISLIGWSAGGVFARAIAHSLPEYVRQVITLGSPFNGIKDKSNVEIVFEIVTGKKPKDIDEIILERASQAPLVPSTAIYSKLDGIVAWQSCIDAIEDNHTENVEVWASHLSLGFDAQTLACIADRLAQPEGEWTPFKYTALGKMFYQLPF
jgi:pimeloyl-ACP methyl ester carboxylesterase